MSDDASEERWLPVCDYEAFYMVSDRGRVWSIPRLVHLSDGRQRLNRGRFLSQTLNHGYPTVEFNVLGHRKRISVHVLVLEAFVGPRSRGQEACHYDADRRNANLSNLRWDTSSANNYDQVRIGVHAGANKRHCNYGHLLVEPNLLPRRVTFQQRACLACSRGRAQVNYYAKTGRPYLSMQEASDRYYAVIMTGEVAA